MGYFLLKILYPFPQIYIVILETLWEFSRFEHIYLKH